MALGQESKGLSVTIRSLRASHESTETGNHLAEIPIPDGAVSGSDKIALPLIDLGPLARDLHFDVVKSVAESVLLVSRHKNTLAESLALSKLLVSHPG